MQSCIQCLKTAKNANENMTTTISNYSKNVDYIVPTYSTQWL